jgi:phosphoribosyl 1,2-cyclic phosphodiesterase
MARYASLFSGSKGNCHYIGSRNEGILIDTGKNAKQICAALASLEIDPKTIGAIFITHEHSDHISGLRVFAGKFHIPVYATIGTLEALSEGNCLSAFYEACPIEWSGVAVGDFLVTCFKTSHDARESVGFSVHMGDGTKISLATDLGVVSDKVRRELYGSELVILEANHDERMLMTGSYPYPLKKRILSDRGHLSNRLCSAELPALIKSGTTRLILAHLSEENNAPSIAFQAATESLSACHMTSGVDYELLLARQNLTSRMIYL